MSSLFDIPKGGLQNDSEILRDALNEASLLLDGVKQFRESLAIWQLYEKMDPKQFEVAYVVLCKAGLLDWAETCLNLEELYKAVTGEEVNEQRLLTLAKEHKRGGFE